MHGRRIGALIVLMVAGVAAGCRGGCSTPCGPGTSAKLDRRVLDESLELGTQFLLANQKPEGNFNYEYDWKEQTLTKGDSQVRQAGATWGLALIFHAEPSDEVEAGLRRALGFWERHTREVGSRGKIIAYPGERAGRTGTVALVSLALIDYLRTEAAELTAEERAHYEEMLEGYLTFLVAARTPEGQWHGSYSLRNGGAYGPPSPYFDGESLLALVKAARYLGKDALQPIIHESAEVGYQTNVVEARAKEADSDITKGYYQWGSMAFFELATSGWPDTAKWSERVIDMANWMIDTHRTLSRRRNTAYAYEGIIPAYELAKQSGDRTHRDKFRLVINEGMAKLTSWQVGHSIANACIPKETSDPLARGGIQNHHAEPPLRIDVTQHQMAAVILARRYVYEY